MPDRSKHHPRCNHKRKVHDNLGQCEHVAYEVVAGIEQLPQPQVAAGLAYRVQQPISAHQQAPNPGRTSTA
jgi:hypothetical protein